MFAAASAWDLGLAVLKSGGLTALLFFSTLVVAGYALRVVWMDNQALRAQIAELQNRRVEEVREVVTETVQAMHDTKSTVDKIAVATEAAVDALRESGR